jgi:predicted transcriptional regulator
MKPEAEAQIEDDRQRRFAREAAGIAEADADIAAGRVVDEAEVDAWIDSIGTDHELPVPSSGR